MYNNTFLLIKISIVFLIDILVVLFPGQILLQLSTQLTLVKSSISQLQVSNMEKIILTFRDMFGISEVTYVKYFDINSIAYKCLIIADFIKFFYYSIEL